MIEELLSREREYTSKIMSLPGNYPKNKRVLIKN